jgi:hypothetical protein
MSSNGFKAGAFALLLVAQCAVSAAGPLRVKTDKGVVAGQRKFANPLVAPI